MADESLVGVKFRHAKKDCTMVAKEYVGKKMYLCEPISKNSKQEPMVISDKAIQDYQLVERIFA